ncbi:MAG: TatD family hydrolase [Bacillota bacterium]|nr:TatD family hydrolase [Bacillota bacterium]
MTLSQKPDPDPYQLPDPVWFDSHAHLQDKAYAADREMVLNRALSRQVCRILLPSSAYEDACQAVSLTESDDRLICAVGCHPHEADGYDAWSRDTWVMLVESHRQAPIVAIGEIGLDYHYDFSPRETQRRVFRDQLELAGELDLPVIIHEREATADCLKILEQAASDGLLRKLPGVFHCFSGSVETAKIVLSMGFYLGFDGPVTFKNARKPVSVVEQCPPDRLLIETDSPYLTPVPYRGKRNEPAYLPLIGARIAEIQGVTVAETARQTTANACRLFGLSDCGCGLATSSRT